MQNSCSVHKRTPTAANLQKPGTESSWQDKASGNSLLRFQYCYHPCERDSRNRIRQRHDQAPYYFRSERYHFQSNDLNSLHVLPTMASKSIPAKSANWETQGLSRMLSSNQNPARLSAFSIVRLPAPHSNPWCVAPSFSPQAMRKRCLR